MIQTTTSQQYGFQRLDFAVPDSPGGFIITPKVPAPGKPWVWYAPTFIRDPHPLPKALHEWYMSRLLEAGIGIAGVDVRESWGNSAGRAIFTQFHTLLVREFGLDAKACLIGQSRGGLMQYNWAVEHPEKVRCIVGIYPVCDVFLRSFSGAISGAYALTQEQLAERCGEHNPVDRVAPLAAACVPIFHIHGDVDDLVPLESNSEALVRNYRNLGGPAELIVLKGKGHAEIPEFFQCPALVEFLKKHALMQ
jgi:pimeloyl-ACP methyl ester carboxylesterase